VGKGTTFRHLANLLDGASELTGNWAVDYGRLSDLRLVSVSHL
jgi:hypothetical protein